MKFNDETMEPIMPSLDENKGEKLHIPVVHDESIFHTNEQRARVWVPKGEQPLRKKGNGRAIHVSDFLTEPTGRLVWRGVPFPPTDNPEGQADLPSLADARRIIYPGKNYDKWWDLLQMMDQLRDTVDIYQMLFPNTIGVYIFDCSSAHEAFAPDALNVNNMNVKPGGKQVKMRDTIIPDNNPPPKPGQPDTRGQKQSMVYPSDHLDASLAGKAKGLVAVLKERVSVWDKLCEASGGPGKVVAICGVCKMSAVRRDALQRVQRAEQQGQDNTVSGELLDAADDGEPDIDGKNDWCCVKKVLSLQRDFAEEKPMIQTYLESRGHICLFLPKFHCELNAIEMYWGFAKYRKSYLHHGY